MTKDQIKQVAELIGRVAVIVSGGGADQVKAASARLAAAVMAEAPHVTETELLAEIDAIIAKGAEIRREINPTGE